MKPPLAAFTLLALPRMEQVESSWTGERPSPAPGENMAALFLLARPPGVAVWSWSHRSWCPHSGWWTLSPCPTSAPSCRTVFCAFPYSGSPSPSCTRCCALSCTHSGFRQHRPSCDKLNLKSISGEDNQNHQNYLFSNSCLLKRHCVLQLWAADLPLNKFSHKDTQLRTEMRTNQFCTPQ